MWKDMDTIVTIVVAIFASTGFWTFVSTMMQKHSAKNRMLLGLGHDRIKYLCEKHIAQGCISSDDFEDLYKYLYVPYRKMGGNGTAEKLMEDVRRLPIRNSAPTAS